MHRMPHLTPKAVSALPTTLRIPLPWRPCWHGFRAENRYIVFQLLGSTASFPPAKWRFLDTCHRKRNLALYDGDYAEDEQLISELIKTAGELQVAVKALGPVGP